MKRSVFIQKTCTACLVGMTGILMPNWASNAYAADKKNKPYKTALTEDNEVVIPLSLFDNSKMQIVAVKTWDYDLAVIQNEDKSFSVFLLKCTHMDNALKVGPDGFSCSLHGSTFNKLGEATKGPAENPLEQYNAVVKDNQIVITAT